MNDASEVDIDRIDRKILAILQTDGRISNLRLAEQVALSPTAVQARVARLTRDGYILGYEARLNPQKLGVGMTVFVEVLLDRTTANVFDEFKAAVQVHPLSLPNFFKSTRRIQLALPIQVTVSAFFRCKCT